MATGDSSSTSSVTATRLAPEPPSCAVAQVAGSSAEGPREFSGTSRWQSESVAPRTEHTPAAIDADRQLELLGEPNASEPIARIGGAAPTGDPSERGRRPARRRTLARLAVSPDEAAELLGVSRDYFDEHVIHELRIVRRGRRILIALTELERWLERSAARATVGRG